MLCSRFVNFASSGSLAGAPMQAVKPVISIWARQRPWLPDWLLGQSALLPWRALANQMRRIHHLLRWRSAQVVRQWLPSGFLCHCFLNGTFSISSLHSGPSSHRTPTPHKASLSTTASCGPPLSSTPCDVMQYCSNPRQLRSLG